MLPNADDKPSRGVVLSQSSFHLVILSSSARRNQLYKEERLLPSVRQYLSNNYCLWGRNIISTVCDVFHTTVVGNVVHTHEQFLQVIVGLASVFTYF